MLCPRAPPAGGWDGRLKDRVGSAEGERYPRRGEYLGVLYRKEYLWYCTVKNICGIGIWLGIRYDL